MKQNTVENLYTFLLKYNNYSEKEKILAKYGLETLYIVVEKTLIVLIISLIFNITKEVIIFLITFGILRTYAGGLHLYSGKLCTICSLIIFFSGYFISKHIYTNNYQTLLYIPIIYFIYKYSPADTSKKPLIRKDLRKKRKIKSLIVISIYLLLSLIIKNKYIVNCLLISSIYNIIMISPITYKIFKKPYNNYLIYENMKERR